MLYYCEIKAYFIQLALALILVPLALIDKGKISAMSVQLTGPIPYAKFATYSQTKTTATQPAAACSFQSAEHLATMMPTTSWHMNMPVLLARAKGFLPTLSNRRIAGAVTTTLRVPVMPVARMLADASVKPRDWKIIGA